MTAVLAGPGAAAGRRTASRLLGWPIRRDPATHVVVADRAMRRRPGLVVHRPRILVPADLTSVDGIPVTTPVRTAIDLRGELRVDRRRERSRLRADVVFHAERLLIELDGPHHRRPRRRRRDAARDADLVAGGWRIERVAAE